MLFQFVTVEPITMINRGDIFQLETTGVMLINAMPIFLVCSYAIRFNNLKLIHYTIMFLVRNEQVHNVAHLHFFVCLLPIGNSQVTNASDMVNIAFNPN